MTGTKPKEEVIKVEIPSLLELHTTRLHDLISRCHAYLAQGPCGKVVLEQLSTDLQTLRLRVETGWTDFVTQNTRRSTQPFSDAITVLFRTSDEMLSELMSKLSVCQTNVPPPPVPAPASSTDFMSYKPPTVNVPKFSGKIDEWKSFWSMFDVLVHSQRNMPAIIKFQLLLEALSGEPKELIRGIQVCETNYILAIKQLSDTYGNDKKILSRLLHSFSSLSSPKHTLEDLKFFTIQYQQLLDQIKSLSNVSGADEFIKAIILQKLSSFTYDAIVNHLKKHDFTLDELTSTLLFFVDTFENRTSIVGNSNAKSQSVAVKSVSAKSDSKNSSKSKNEGKGARSKHCDFCSDSHSSRSCNKYSSHEKRKDRVKELRLCFNCLASGHIIRDCSSKGKCLVCGGKHHTSLCFKDNPRTAINSVTAQSPQVSSSNPVSPSTTSTIVSSSTTSNSAVSKPQSSSAARTTVTSISTIVESGLPSTALPTAIGFIKGPGIKKRVRIFFDSGAQKSFVCSKLASDLDLDKIADLPIQLVTFGRVPEPTTCPIVQGKIIMGHSKVKVNLLAHDHVDNEIHVPGILSVVNTLKDKGIKLADHEINSDTISDIQVVIGSDYFDRFIHGLRKHCGVSTFQSSAGALIFGPMPKWAKCLDGQTSVTASSVFCAKVIVQMPSDVDMLWNLDAIGIVDSLVSPDQRTTMEQVKSSISKEGNHYSVRLPFKSDERPSVNYRIARGQLNSLHDRCEREKGLYESYNAVFKDYLERGFIETTSNESIKGHYLPHHPVFKDSPTTPLRVVFNASSKSESGKSLNDCLNTGPTLTTKLYDCLLQFRYNPFAVISDISKAFHRVRIHSDDRQFCKFLWFDQDRNTQLTFQFLVVMFGATCSPYLLQEVLNTHFSGYHGQFGGDLMSNFYVDNFSKTYQSEEIMMKEKPLIDKVLLEANMPLQGWASNSSTFNKAFDLEFQEEQNVLGLTWNTHHDSLRIELGKKFPVDVNCWTPTKRSFLSITSSVFDPLGLVSPIIICGKILIQDIWKGKFSWDEKLDAKLAERAKSLVSEYKQINLLTFPRMSIFKESQLHIFVDASSKAFGAAAYSVDTNSHTSRLITSKSRVAPCKASSLTIPKLELAALTLGCKLGSHLMQVLKVPPPVVWSDSKVALSWAKSTKDIKNVFVANRVAEIQTTGFQLMHVPSSDNPADILSRGCSVSELVNSSLWNLGPAWLISQDYPSQDAIYVVVNEITVEIQPVVPILPSVDLEKYSNLVVPKNLAKRLLTFCNKSRDPLEALIIQEQQYHSPSIYFHLENKQIKVNSDISNTIKQLNLFMDNKVVKSAGRLDNSSLNHLSKTPYFLPSQSRLVILLIRYVHVSNLHCGLGQTLALYRSYAWTPKLRTRVKSFLSRCVLCRRAKAKTLSTPPPPPLPTERVSYRRPFAHTGVDHTGSITVKTKNGERRKVYLLLFVCTASRATHIEVTKSLTSYDFILCLRRFAAHHGTPSTLLSDNAANFHAAERFLLDLYDDPEVKSYCQNKSITWRFQTPRAPWTGGFFERLVGIVKSTLATSLQRKLLTTEELRTVVAECQTVVNNRPLTYQTTDSIEEPLTPSHLLYGRMLNLLPPLQEYLADDDYVQVEEEGRLLRHQYHVLSSTLRRFENRWRTEYLTALRSRHRVVASQGNCHEIKIGDIVMVSMANRNRLSWPLGRICKLLPDSTGTLRTVEVLFENKTHLRPIAHIVPLEVSRSDDLPAPRSEAEESPNNEVQSTESTSVDNIGDDTVPEAHSSRSLASTAEIEETPVDTCLQDDAGPVVEEADPYTSEEDETSNSISDGQIVNSSEQRPTRTTAVRARQKLQKLIKRQQL